VYDTYYAESRADQAVAGDGSRLHRTRGSHHQFIHPTKVGTLTVPHPKKDLGKGLLVAILKQAGLN
jgi:predicted RNA binding protein YcfA (HicA-like mRNA interferase family)